MDLSPPQSGRPPLRIWAVADGRAGIENQALGLAEAVARQWGETASVEIKRLLWRKWLRRVPTRFVFAPRQVLDPASDALAPPWPDVWIAAGRASIPASIAVRRWSAGRTFVVQVQDPLRNPRLFDLVVPPTHDRLEGPNVFPILGAPHRVTPERLAEEGARFAEAFSRLPHPRVAVLVGGKSKAFDLPPARAEALAGELDRILDETGGSILMTFSRRTPRQAEAILRARLAGRPGLIWDGQGDNPYFAMLAHADQVLVTADSINMVTEAAAAGKPVQIVPMQGSQARKERFHADLAARDVARPFRGVLEHWTSAPLRETDRAAAEVLRRLGERRAGRLA